MSSDNGWGNTLAGASVTGGLVAVLYGVMKLVRRSRCASHTRCCDIDVARSQEGDRNEIVLQVMQELQAARKKRQKIENDTPSD